MAKEITINDLEQRFEASEHSDDPRRHARFCKRLLSSEDPEILRYHFELLKRRDNWELYLEVRAAFGERGQAAEAYLIDRLKTEQDTLLRSDGLHLLGTMRSPAAAPLARQSIDHQDPELREVACYVLGWTGSVADVSLLRDRLLNDPEPDIRSTAASAHSQLAERLPEATEKVVASLKEGLRREKDLRTLGWIIITLQYVTELDFGLEEIIGEDDFTGDVEQAKTKAIRALS